MDDDKSGSAMESIKEIKLDESNVVKSSTTIGANSKLDSIIEKFSLMPLFYCLIVFLLTAVIASFVTKTELLTYMKLFVALFFYLVVPGYMLLLNINMDSLERIILATAVGITLIPLVLFNLNLFVVKATPLLTWGLILLVSLAGMVIKWKSR